MSLQPEVAEIFVRGVAAGALSVWGIGLLLSKGPPGPRVGGAIFCLSAIGYAFNEYSFTRDLIGSLSAVLWLFAVACVGWLWVFGAALFRDRTLDWRLCLVPLALNVTGAFALLAPFGWRPWPWIVHHLVEIGIAGHLIWSIRDTWGDDLVEARRRLRGPVMAALALFAIGLAVAQINRLAGAERRGPDVELTLIFAALAIAGAATFLRSRNELFGTSAPAARSDGEDPLQTLLMTRLNEQMRDQEAWRSEGLTIAQLAAAIDAPEHRLRRLINDQLGYRNFAAFINGHRIEAAKVELADPARARKNVATIAFDLGFGSLGPFNRAFRAAVGLTPTEYRRQALAAALPDSEIRAG